MRTGKPITRLDRYMFRQLALALIAVTGGLTALIWLVQSLRFVELVVNHGLSLGVFMQLTGLLIPSFVAVILPITTFVVVQFIYQRMAGDREITVMRAAGLSPWALSRPALALTVLVIAACYVLNLWLVPASLTSFRQFQWEIRNQMAAFLLQEGVFTQVSDDLTVYVRSRDPDGTLRGILVDDERDKAATATILAEHGRLVEGPSGPRVLLVSGSRQEIDHQTGRLNVLTFAQNELDLTDNARNDGERLRDMTELPLDELLDPHPPNRPRHAEMDCRSTQAPGKPADRTFVCDGRTALGAQRNIPPAWQHRQAAARRERRGGAACHRAGSGKSRRARQRAAPAGLAPGAAAGRDLRLGSAWPAVADAVAACARPRALHPGGRGGLSG